MLRIKKSPEQKALKIKKISQGKNIKITDNKIIAKAKVIELMYVL